jgi:hypothetical protein
MFIFHFKKQQHPFDEDIYSFYGYDDNSPVLQYGRGLIVEERTNYGFTFDIRTQELDFGEED